VPRSIRFTLARREPRPWAPRRVAFWHFPNVVKAGLVVGGQGGDGVLLVNDKVVDHYNTAAVSVGLQAGAQSFGYVLFFMSDKVFNDFRNSKNFEIGVGPNIVIIDAGAAKDLNTETVKARRVCHDFRPEGPDGRCRPARLEDHQTQALNAQSIH
jgi:hypothetical protein